MEENQSNSSFSSDEYKKKEATDLLNNNIEYLSKIEYDFLLNLINTRDYKSFRENIWHFFQQRKKQNDVGENNINSNDSVSHKVDKYKIHTLTKEINIIQKSLSEYMSRLTEVEEANSILTLRNKTLENAFNEKDTQINESNKKIKTLEGINADLLSKVQQERIDEKIPNYVSNVKSELGSDDAHFIKMSIIWAMAGVCFGIAAVSMSLYTLFLKIDFININASELFYIFSRGLIGITILSWLSFICLGNSKKYTHESIRRKDRRHALMFGQVYLQIYGTTASKEDAILVFKDWNMSGDSAFSGQTEQPPNALSFISNAKEKLKSTVEPKESN